MERRDMFKRTFAGALGVFGLTTVARAAESGAANSSARMRVVYHLSDSDKVNFVLGNIKNHIAGTGGPGKADIRLVVHGPALKAFHSMGVDPRLSEATAGLMKEGVGIDACANTMKAQNITVNDLIPGFGVAEKGGVVRLTELQMQGYHYLRP